MNGLSGCPFNPLSLFANSASLTNDILNAAVGLKALGYRYEGHLRGLSKLQPLEILHDLQECTTRAHAILGATQKTALID
jgi:hypothetical protein